MMILNIVIAVSLYAIIGGLLCGIFEDTVVEKDCLLLFGIFWPLYCLYLIGYCVIYPFLRLGNKIRDKLKLFSYDINKKEYYRLHKLLWVGISDYINDLCDQVMSGQLNLSHINELFNHPRNIKNHVIDNTEDLFKWKKNHNNYPINSCFACEANPTFYTSLYCDTCLIDWGTNRCEDLGSDYVLFRDHCYSISSSYDIEMAVHMMRDASKIAKKISELPMRK